MDSLSKITTLLQFLDSWKFLLTVLGTVAVWFLNERRKLLAEQYLRKETSYGELLRTLRGFYVGIENQEQLKNEFINQLNKTWLYCPDEVIKKAYAFLDTVHDEPRAKPHDVKEDAMGALVLAIRKDLLSRSLVKKTKLVPADFKHLKANGVKVASTGPILQVQVKPASPWNMGAKKQGN